MIVIPTALGMSLERIALGTILFRTIPNLPAGDESMNMLDPFDTDFLLVDCLPYAFQPFDIRL